MVEVSLSWTFFRAVALEAPVYLDRLRGSLGRTRVHREDDGADNSNTAENENFHDLILLDA